MNDLAHATEQTFDVIVVGSGAAGLSAAVAALDQGASVLVLEAAGRAGGTTARSGGYAWIPNNSMMRARGLVDTREDALRYLSRTAYPGQYDANHPTLGLTDAHYQLLCTFYDRGADVVDRLAALGALQPVQEINEPGYGPYTTMAWSDYYEYLPEDKAPEGRNFRTRPQPVPMPEDLMNRPAARGGWDFVQQLLRGVEKHGGELRVEHRVRGVLLNDRREVVGVEAEAGDAVQRIWARRGVIFGTGGFTHDAGLRTSLLRGPTYGGCAAPEARGDFLKIGWALNAATANLDSGWWQQLPFERSLHDPSNQNNVFSVPGDSMILVNHTGRRVVNEKDVYQERTKAHFVWDEEKQEFPNRILFMIYDQRTADLMAGSVPLPAKGENDPATVSGKTAADLTEKLRAKLAGLAAATEGLTLDDDFAANLESTIRRFNRYAAHGVDPDFRRGGQIIDIARQGAPLPGNTRNSTMFPLAEEGPFYAVLLGGAVLDTNGGPVIDDRAQVLGADGAPIGGLYGAGNCIASPSANAYWAGGCTIGLAITYGFIAGENVAKEPDRLSTSTRVESVQGAAALPVSG